MNTSRLTSPQSEYLPAPTGMALVGLASKNVFPGSQMRIPATIRRPVEDLLRYRNGVAHGKPDATLAFTVAEATTVLCRMAYLLPDP